MEMKRIMYMLAAALAAVSCLGPKPDCSVPCRFREGALELKTPARPAGQENALKLTDEPIDTVRVGFVGLGMRGSDAIRRFTYIEGAMITAICDLEPERVDSALEFLRGNTRRKAMGVDGASGGTDVAGSVSDPLCFSGEEGWKQLCESPEVDLVYVCTHWQLHTPIAVYAMEHGKHVAVEVPAAMSIAECWQLVNTCERTRRHCMMLENCVYDFYEMTALNMAQQGLFGEIYHAEGAYIHNLDPFWEEYWGNWRLKYNAVHRGDNYPTHGIGPVCQALNIHRGDRMDYVVSMDTKSVHGAQKAAGSLGTGDFANGDHTVSLIRTAGGHQIEIQHNVYGARPYSRMYQLVGSEGFATKYPSQSFSVDASKLPSKEVYAALNPERAAGKAAFDSLCAEFKHPITAYYERKAREVGGHGGMDFIMDSRLIYCLRNGLPLDEDVYDAAEWSCLTELSRLSIEAGSVPVKVPDFTRGDWDVLDGLTLAPCPGE